MAEDRKGPSPSDAHRCTLPQLKEARTSALWLTIQNSYVHSEEELVKLTPGDLRNRISGGEQQKLLVLRAVLYQPQVLFCDEITSGMDSCSSAEFYSMMKKYLTNATIICTVHRQDELNRFDVVRDLTCFDRDLKS